MQIPRQLFVTEFIVTELMIMMKTTTTASSSGMLVMMLKTTTAINNNDGDNSNSDDGDDDENKGKDEDSADDDDSDDGDTYSFPAGHNPMGRCCLCSPKAVGSQCKRPAPTMPNRAVRTVMPACWMTCAAGPRPRRPATEQAGTGAGGVC